MRCDTHTVLPVAHRGRRFFAFRYGGISRPLLFQRSMSTQVLVCVLPHEFPFTNMGDQYRTCAAVKSWLSAYLTQYIVRYGACFASKHAAFSLEHRSPLATCHLPLPKPIRLLLVRLYRSHSISSIRYLQQDGFRRRCCGGETFRATVF